MSKIQAVRKFQYVATPSFDVQSFSDSLTQEVALLPQGAAVLGVHLEVLSAFDTGVTADIGLGNTQDFFLNDIALTTPNTHSDSSVKTITKERTSITITLNKAITKGELRVFVEFALPTTYDYEV